MCAARRLARLLAERGDPEKLAQILRARADAGNWFSAGRLADLLAKHGDLDGLRARVSIGDEYAGSRLSDQLAGQGRDEEAKRLRMTLIAAEECTWCDHESARLTLA